MSNYKVEISGVDTRNLKVLTSEEMTELFKNIKTNPFARNDLVEGNLKLVLSILKRFKNYNENLDDLFQVGCIGLVKSIDNFDLDAYDSLILPGAMDIREAIENKKIIDFIKKFDGKTIGAISIAPLLLVRAGLLNGKPFMAGVNKEEIFEEGFSESDLAEMVGWDDNINKPIKDGYIITGNIITSISYNFVKWALAFGKMVGIDIPAKTFGIQ